MNPPFSVVGQCRRPHRRRRLAPCRLGAWRASPKAAGWSRSPARAARPDNPSWRDAFVRLQERGRVVFSAAIDGAVYARHGTTIETRLTVIDRVPADDPTAFPASRRHGAGRRHAARLGHGARSAAAAARDALSPLRRSRVRPFREPSAPTPRARPRIAAPTSDPAAASNSPTRPSTGRRPRAAASPRRSTKNTRLQSIRIPGSQAASDQARAVGGDGLGRAAQAVLSAASAGQRRHRRPAVRRPARKRHLCRRGPCRPSRRIVDRRRDLRRRLRRARRRRERRALPPRLVSGRRHRRRQGPPGRRHPARQLAEGPPPRGLDLQVRQADRGRPARLVGARHGAAAGHAARRASARARRSVWSKASFLPPTPRCAPTRATRRFRASSRSSIGWAPTSTE